MARNTYTLGGRTFTSREKVRMWMAEIRAAYTPAETIADPERVPSNSMSELLRVRHIRLVSSLEHAILATKPRVNAAKSARRDFTKLGANDSGFWA